MKDAARAGAQALVKPLGYLSQEAVARIASTVSWNLVVEADMAESPFLPSKFADCAVSGKPILAITPPKSEIRSLFCEYGGGIAVSNDATEIVAGIVELLSSGRIAAPTNGTLSARFTADSIVKAYRDMFCKVRETARC